MSIAVRVRVASMCTFAEITPEAAILVASRQRVSNIEERIHEHYTDCLMGPGPRNMSDQMNASMFAASCAYSLNRNLRKCARDQSYLRFLYTSKYDHMKRSTISHGKNHDAVRETSRPQFH